MKLIFASDSFKGTLSSPQTAALLGAAAREVFGEYDAVEIPVADGGEGTTETVLSARKGTKIYAAVHGPLMEPVRAYFGVLDNDRSEDGEIQDAEMQQEHAEKKAIMEMAQASGLPLVPAELRDPRRTTSYGTGELVLAALDAGCTHINIAIGGSATNDGGMGFASALGIRFLDRDGNPLEGVGGNLAKVCHVEMSGLDPRVKDTAFTIMSDVTNPLCGPDGATYTFGPQKGGTPEILEELEAGMQNYKNVIIREFGIDPDETPGSGAAGGLGTALLVFLNGRMRSGIETVLDLVEFDKLAAGSDLIITGEGRTDWQSSHGKVLQGIGEHALELGIPAVALSGGLGPGYESIYNHGIVSLMTTVDGPMTLDHACANADALYKKAAVRLFRLIKAGMAIRH